MTSDAQCATSPQPSPKIRRGGQKSLAPVQVSGVTIRNYSRFEASPNAKIIFVAQMDEHIGAEALSVPSPYPRRGRGRGCAPRLKDQASLTSTAITLKIRSELFSG